MQHRTPNPATEARALQAFQDVRVLLRWNYAARLSVATTIMLAAHLVWKDEAGRGGTPLIATIVFALTVVLTATSWFYSEAADRRPAPWFLLGQSVIDLLLVTVLVELTGAGESPLAAFYVVVVAVAFLLSRALHGIFVTFLAGALYCAVVFLREPSVAAIAPTSLQLLVFALVALFSRNVSVHLKRAGAGSAELESQLKAMRLQAAEILRNIGSGLITVDATGRLLQANPAAERLLGIELEESLGKPVLSRLHEVSPDLTEMLVHTVKRGTRIVRGEAQLLAENGIIPLGVTTTMTPDANGDPASATAIFQDISESKRMELVGLRAERLAAVAELSASLAHEIKNPLASIRSAVEQLARVSYAGEDERTLAALVERESDRLSRLLSEFLDFARVQAADFRRLDIVALSRGAAALAAAHPAVSGVEIDFAAEASRIEIDGDEDLLHRAIFNLVLNAAQASPEGGRVTVRVVSSEQQQLPESARLGSNAVEVTITNQGEGIPVDVRERMFDPFFTTKIGGSGLGLSVVHRAITSHRGVIHVDSDATSTRFTVLLPCDQAPMGEPA